MPSLKKKALSLYLRTGCLRQLALTLYSDPELRERSMPPRQTARPGLGLVGQAGYEWQDEKIGELAAVFGAASLHISSLKTGNRPAAVDLATVLPKLGTYQFVVEARYGAETQTFKNAIGISDLRDLYGDLLGVGEAAPDLIQVLAPMSSRPEWEWDTETTGPDPLSMEVLPDGTIGQLPPGDPRLRLRIIDIKQSAEPGAHYFAEVVYYAITLSCWLAENRWTDRFAVVAASAVWPGSFDASTLMLAREQCRKEGREPRPDELARALHEDIEVAPFEVFAPRLWRFFQEEIPQVLQTPWNALPWHVSYKCKGCEFLGYPWQARDGKLTNHPLHCWPTAARTDHLCRIAGLSKGGAQLLMPIAADVTALADVSPGHTAFDGTPTLRAKRNLYPRRARSLAKMETAIIPGSGSDAQMPRWPDLHIYIFLDYDISSAITAAFGLRAFWVEPCPFGISNNRRVERWGAAPDGKPGLKDVFVVDRRSLDREREELLKFLRTLKDILERVRNYDQRDIAEGRRGPQDRLKVSTYQIYLWDDAQRNHLVRTIGRHLDAVLGDTRLRDLAWLFPPPELLAHPEDASHRSPFTLVSSVVQNTVAVPTPHHYTLLDVAATYRQDASSAPTVHPLYREPLSDLIPGERLHEMWTRRGDWLQTAGFIAETTSKKVRALSLVVGRLEQDLRNALSRSSAPPVVRSSVRLPGVPPHAALWYEYTRLNAVLDELDDQTTRAMPPQEREARYKSAHLLHRLEGQEKEEALGYLRVAAGHSLPSDSSLVVYKLSQSSLEVNIRPPALGYALSPKAAPQFLNEHAYPLLKDLQVGAKGSVSVGEAGLTAVSVLAIDRAHALIALKPGQHYLVPLLEAAGKVSLAADIMLDPIGNDFLSKKIRMTVQGIGRPCSAQHDSTTCRALGFLEPNTAEPGTPECPASEFLWQAPSLAATMLHQDLEDARRALASGGVHLNDSQWKAWEAALGRRLALIWGPPGTGKSHVLDAVVAGAVWLAHRSDRPLRLLIAAGTYAAVDNVLFETCKILARLLPPKPYRIYRLRSDYSEPPSELDRHPEVASLMVKTTQTSADVLDLQQVLEEPKGIIVVAGPSQQLHNLAVATKNKTKRQAAHLTQRKWFDLVVIDEASQLDVATSTLIVSKAADEARFVLAGDDKQLPPIHAATPPLKLEHVVGSVYGYLRHYHHVSPHSLQVNYRACETLVEFTKRAGYDPDLHAHHRDLRLAVLDGPLPNGVPAGWPDGLWWTPDWIRLLDAGKPATCFIYEDELSGQANDFESDAVASLLWLCFRLFDQKLSGEFDNMGKLRNLTGRPYDPGVFWRKGVGVVTPHRAQIGKIVTRLHTVFPNHDPAMIWSAVDTVERFQGQQRDIVVASFGLGDPDLIEAEDEFLYSLNRFNVMASRARAKLIVLTTRSLVDYLADDAEVLENSRLLKHFVGSFCQNPQAVTLGYMRGGLHVLQPGVMRSR